MSSDDSKHAPDRRMAIATFLAAFCVAAVVGFTSGRFAVPRLEQPIAFNHRKHAVVNQIRCSTCHAFYESETFAGLPDADICSTCHRESQGRTLEEARLISILRGNRSLVWKSLFRQPSHIFYSHRLHAVKAQIKCEQCHGDIAQTTSPPLAVRKLKMADCVGCHERAGVPVDCDTCHR